MIADRDARLKNPGGTKGGATWFESLRWFSDQDGYRPSGHVRVGFSPRNLQHGFKRLRADGLVTWEHRSTSPDQPGRRFRSGRCNIYKNRFNRARRGEGGPRSKPQPRGWPRGHQTGVSNRKNNEDLRRCQHTDLHSVRARTPHLGGTLRILRQGTPGPSDR